MKSRRSSAASSNSGKPGAVHTHHAGTAQVLGDRVAADANHGCDLMAALATDMLESKNFSKLKHRQSLAWHGVPRRHLRQDFGCRVEPCRVIQIEDSPAGSLRVIQVCALPCSWAQ
jgi:hypothetical protein